MIIKSRMSLPITIWRKQADGSEKRDVVVLKPGEHNYRDIDPKDPRVAEQLRVFRKHSDRNGVQFEELLPTDVEIMKKLKGSPQEKAEQLKVATSTKPHPVKRMKPTKEMQARWKGKPDGRGTPENSPSNGTPGEKKGTGKGSR